MNAMTLTKTETAASEPFPFFILPPETQFKVLEHTELVSPKGYFTWSDRDGFDLPGERSRKRTWRNPKSLFLVSKLFSLRAKNVFWMRNGFEIQPDHYAMTRTVTPGMPTREYGRYAASKFFVDVISKDLLSRPEHFQHISFKLYSMVPKEPKEDEARAEWFRIVEGAVRSGLAIGCLSISFHLPNDPTAAQLLSLSKGDCFRRAREAVKADVWPLVDGQAPMGILKELSVTMSDGDSDGDTGWRYRLRKVGTTVSGQKEDRLIVLGPKRQRHPRYKQRSRCHTRTVSLVDVARAEDSQEEDGAKTSKWLEEVFIEPPFWN